MNERLSQIIRHPKFIPVTVGIVSFGAGFGLGYILGRREKFQLYEVPSRVVDLSEVRENVNQSKELTFSIPDDSGTTIDNDTVKHFIDGKLQEPITEAEPEETIDRNIFAGSDDEWDYEEEKKHRNSSDPYVLHRDEFYADELSYTQTTLTYYAGDDIMADESDTPVYNHRTVVGELKFGHGSGDPNVFYVRNDKRRAEYEILHDSGFFSVEVLGVEIENNERVKDIKHDNNRKFRQQD